MDSVHFQMEFDARLEEYRTLKSEIISNLNAGRNVANLCLTAVGLLIAASPSIIANNLPVIFLIAPLFFYGLAWTQLRYVYLVLDMGKYGTVHVEQKTPLQFLVVFFFRMPLYMAWFDRKNV